MEGWWRWALVSPDGVVPSRMVCVSASANLPLHHKVQKFSSGTSSSGWSWKKGRKTVVCVCVPGGRKSRVRREWSGGLWSTEARSSRRRTSVYRRTSSSTTMVGIWCWAIRRRRWRGSTRACWTTSTPLDRSSIQTSWRTGERYAARFRKHLVV